MRPVALAIVCKTPIPGASKTRLSPPLRPEECAAISSCFIRDLSATLQSLVDEGGAVGHAVYTPIGSEDTLRPLLPDSFNLTLQHEGDLGSRLLGATKDLLKAGCAGVVLINSDSPTLPKQILRKAIEAVRVGNNVVLGPAIDGGYTLIGLSGLHPRLFEEIPWSTADVYSKTVERAAEIQLPVVNVPVWYDVDDALSFGILIDEFSGQRPHFAELHLAGSEAPATRQFMRQRGSVPPVGS
jgi:rSAM/selenodomain-associated transferase 1